MTRLTINRRNYNIKRWGSGLPIVMLHGFTGSVQNWNPIAERLSRHYQITAIDILGFGDSDKPQDIESYHMENIASDLSMLLRSLSAAPMHLVGYSMGGRLALYMIWRYPQLFTSATLESTSSGLKTQIERIERAERDNALADRIEHEGIEAFVDFWETLPIWESQQQLSEEIKQQQHQQRLSNDPVGVANSLRGMGTGVQPSLWNDLEDIQIPVQLIAGEQDPKFMRIMGEMYQMLPCSRLNTIADVGHNTHLENPTIYTQHLLEFLDDIASGQACLDKHDALNTLTPEFKEFIRQ